MAVIIFNGISQFIFIKLFFLAPFIEITLLNFLLFDGILIDSSPNKYLAVIDDLFFLRLFILPLNTTRPPSKPALGPISMIQSAFLIISKSCSINKIVLSKFFKFFIVLYNFSTSI